MELFNNLPLYVMDIDLEDLEPTGVDFVALVDLPAIQKSFLAFNAHLPKRMSFEVTSEDRHIVSGPLMLADTPIYRRDEGDAEYYVSFPAATIERISKKFFKMGNQANVNEMHDPSKKVEGVVMFESWLSDKSRGIAPMRGYEDAPEGSWFGSFSVDNPEVWAQIKAGTFTGFSVEGIFSRIIPQDAPDFTPEEMAQIAVLQTALNIL